MTISSEGVSEYGALSAFDRSRYQQANGMAYNTDLLDRVQEIYDTLKGVKIVTVTVPNTAVEFDAAVATIGNAYEGGAIIATLDDANKNSTEFVKSAQVYDDNGTTKVKVVVDQDPANAAGAKVFLAIYLP